MDYSPKALAEPLPMYAIGLANEAHGSELIVYAGAGVSRSSGLPSGEDLAEQLHTALQAMGVDVTQTEPRDLLAIGDLAEQQQGGVPALQEMAVALAPFTEADPTFPHRALALLLLEGALVVMTTNWDSCIERAIPGQVISPIVTDADRLLYRGTRLYKVHGCAHRPATVLVTRSQLGRPPVWAEAEVAAALGRATVIFIGIGDVAPYVRSRLEALLERLGDTDHVRVASPGISNEWLETQWSTLLPHLPEENKLPLSAAELCDMLLRAWVRMAITRWQTAATDSGDATLTQQFADFRDQLLTHRADDVVLWLRSLQYRAVPSFSAVHDSHALQLMLAFAVALNGQEMRFLGAGRPLACSDFHVDMLFGDGSLHSSAIVREAHRRVTRLREVGALAPDDHVDVICSGYWGELAPSNAEGLQQDVVAEPLIGDVVDGPAAAPPTLLSAQALLGGGLL